MTTHTEWAGFLASTVAGSVIVPAAFKTSIDHDVIFRVANMPTYFQFSVKYLLSCLRVLFNYKVFSVSFPSVYKFWLYFLCIWGKFWVVVISSAFSIATSGML